MARKHTYRVTLPDGKEYTRTTARTYTHAIAVRTEGDAYSREGWWVWGYNGSEAIAQRESMRAARHSTAIREVRILPIEQPRAYSVEPDDQVEGWWDVVEGEQIVARFPSKAAASRYVAKQS